MSTPQTPAPPLAVSAAVLVREGRLLVVSKQAAPGLFYLPGGKPDPGETPEEALHRELAEELGITLRHHRFLAEIHATAALEGVPMRMRVYEVDTSDTPRPAAELAALRWTDGRDPDLRLAPAVSGQVVPLLRERGLLS
ncbi:MULTISPECIES: NUDIX hydrolase [Streptomyces]|uniref:8-oxo-dGTP diphosphatase n=1 Tax=Streptomyces koyangensis TaxID=188770 RepID=A0A385DMS7_9ACTN|nr:MULTISPECIES: NUDIX domain-containing protein [Streptomyces]AXQ59017.1 NUDIX domain-containing protein [Streptomyces koyangensis]RZE98482.1 NUDIX domain-containing protein [Streptomyces sp. SCA2-2]